MMRAHLVLLKPAALLPVLLQPVVPGDMEVCCQFSSCKVHNVAFAVPYQLC